MVAITVTKEWDRAELTLDSANIASAEAIPEQTFGAVLHLFNAVAVTSMGRQSQCKDIPVLETPKEIAAIEHKASRENQKPSAPTTQPG
jgi:hypothetical protein